MSDLDRLILVRHAMPEVDPAVPAESWHLGAEGRAAARALRPLVAGPAYWVASTEPKAVETLREIAGSADVATDSGFAEVRRPAVWSAGTEYRDLAYAYADGTDHDGWEARRAVTDRFEAAVSRHAVLAAGRTLVIGTHGLAQTVWLASRSLIGDPGEFWAGLRLPNVREIDLTGR